MPESGVSMEVAHTALIQLFPRNNLGVERVKFTNRGRVKIPVAYPQNWDEVRFPRISLEAIGVLHNLHLLAA